jgi:DNA-binding NarL/FixJ family response regulator
MTDANTLNGRRVLVVEDDYFLASDAAGALQDAGAEVLGPCPNAETASDALEQGHPDAVVLDINLGAGASFCLARELKDRHIPFVFLTGYDRETIPSEYADVEQLIKPVRLRTIVRAVSKLLAPQTAPV